MKRFNLIKEPWLKVVDLDGERKTLGLSEVLSGAHTIRELAGEIPAQDLAILRLLLGVLYPIYTRQDLSGNEHDEYSNMAEAWNELWERGKFGDEVGNYLKIYEDRFWLIHPDHPFFQVPCFDANDTPRIMTEGKDKGKKIYPFFSPENNNSNGLEKLVGDIGGDNYFGLRRSVDSLDFGEAARWLVYNNIFSMSVSGDTPKGYCKIVGYKQPYPAYLSHVTVRGENLFETLMLNLVLDNKGKPWEDSQAWWEKPYLFETDRTGLHLDTSIIPEPMGITEYMSTVYRYVRLIPSETTDKVISWVIWSGLLYDSMVKEKGTPILYKAEEQMALWQPVNKSGDILAKQITSMSAQVWRDYASMAVLGSKGSESTPGVLLWLNQLAEAGISLPKIRVGVDGVIYKSGTLKEGDYSDVLSVNAGVLANLTEDWNARILIELGVIDKKIGNVYGALVGDTLNALGLGGDKGKTGIVGLEKEQLYRHLDTPFRNWLADISLADDIDAKGKEWREYADKEIRVYATNYVNNAGKEAFVGHKHGIGNKAKLYTSTKAYNEFNKRMFDADSK